MRVPFWSRDAGQLHVPRSRLAALAIVTAAIALAVAPAGILAAGGVQEFQASFDGTFTISWCGIDGLTDHQVAHWTFVTAPDLGLPRQMVFQDRETITDNAGRTLGFAIDELDKDVSITQNADGTITFLSALNGMPERITTPDGKVITQDTGRIVFESTFDAQDNLLEQHVVTMDGPHPEVVSGFALQCQIVAQYLG